MDYKNIQHFFYASAIISSAYATEDLTINQAQKLLFDTADKFEAEKLILNSDQRDQIKSLSGMRQKSQELNYWKVYNKDKFLGWILQDDVIGKHENITYALAISSNSEVAGVEILNYRETHGHEIKRKDWRDRFKKKKLSDPFKLDVDVPNISGATLSSRNLTDGIKRLLTIHTLYLK